MYIKEEDKRIKQKMNKTEFPFFNYNGKHLRKQRKTKAKDACKNQFENKKLDNFFAARRNIAALRKKLMKVINQTGHKNKPIILG